MRRLLSISLVAMTISTASFAGVIGDMRVRNAGEGFYMGANLGGFYSAQNFKEVEGYAASGLSTTSPFIYGGHFGYKFNPMFRMDINGQYRAMTYEALLDTTQLNQKINNSSIFLNAYVDIPNETVFTPYVTAGVGYAHSNAKDLVGVDATDPDNNFTASGSRSNNFAFNLGFGTKMKLYEQLDIDLGYRYTDLGTIKVGATTAAGGGALAAASQNLRTHEVLFGITYNF